MPQELKRCVHRAIFMSLAFFVSLLGKCISLQQLTCFFWNSSISVCHGYLGIYGIEYRINSFILISKIGREWNELIQDSKTENESEGPFSPWPALVALTSSFCLLHSCWSLFTARFFSCGSDWTELIGTIAYLTALAAQPDTTAYRTLLALSIKLLYLEHYIS